MINLYFWPTPNGKKVSILLSELNLNYNLISININKGDQFKKSFLKISPNNKIPALEIIEGKNTTTLFESGSIMLFLADKYKKFISNDQIKKHETIQWLMWQMAGFGPMLGQAHHFNFYAKDKIDYAVNRYSMEAKRLYNVLDKRLTNKDWVMDEYSIVDMAIYPWTITTDRQGIKIEEFPNVLRWKNTMKERPAVKIGMHVGKELKKQSKFDENSRENLFGANQYKKR